jgi:quercetin dioxygenase-like cupin family protein
LGGGRGAFAQAPSGTTDRLVAAGAAAPVNAANVDLGAEFSELAGFRFTQNIYTIAPGTGRAMHSHNGQPEIVRIISGTLTDSRNGEPPTASGPGSTILNLKNTKHMWANLGTEPVVFIASSVRSPPKSQTP